MRFYNVGPLGKLVGKPEEGTSPKEIEEKPPTIDLKEFRLINSFQVKRVLIDDEARALYTHKESGEETFMGGCILCQIH